MDMPMPMPMPMTPPTHDHENTTMKGMSMMHMSFFWGKDVIILFQGWPDNNLGQYILSLIFVFVLSAAVELLSAPPSTAKPTASPAFTGMFRSAVYAIRMALAYMVMLSVMSFNVGVFIFAVAGHTLGFFIVKFRALSSASADGTETNAPKL